MLKKTFWSKLAAVVSTLVVTAIVSSMLGVLAISPSFGYGGGRGRSSSGGSGGSSTSHTTVKLTDDVAGGVQTAHATSKVSDDGVVHKTTVIKSLSNEIRVEIPQGAEVTDQKGQVYSGTIAVPKVVLETALPSPVPTGVKVRRVFTVATEGGVKFNKPISITVPITGGMTGDLKVWYYDPASNSYKLAGDGGVVAPDGKSITVTVDHLTYFVVGTADGAEGVKGFTDIDTHWAKDFIGQLADKGVVSGKSSGVYQPNGYLTRAEAAKIVLGALGYAVEKGGEGFADSKDHWGVDIIATAKAKGVISGYPDGTFKPNNYISRAEVLTMLLNAKGVSASGAAVAKFGDVDQKTWYAPFVNFAVEKGVVSGYEDGTFGPGNNVTRGEMSKLAIMVMGL